MNSQKGEGPEHSLKGADRIAGQGSPQLSRVYTDSDGPIDLNRALGPGTSGGVGGIHVTRKNLSDPNILPAFASDHIPGSTPNRVTEIEVPRGGILPDPTGDNHPETGWIAPNTPGTSIVNVWDVDWGDFLSPPKITPRRQS